MSICDAVWAANTRRVYVGLSMEVKYAAALRDAPRIVTMLAGGMMAGFVGRIAKGISERFASTWRLLSETTAFLSRTSVFVHYEAELASMRLRLASARGDDTELRKVRSELIALRGALRLQGYDLTLGGLELAVKGFRNDAALSQGFRRLVLFLGSRDIWAIAGDENHRALHDALEDECEKRRMSDILQKHYLWFNWYNGLLTISGADSESAEDFEAFKKWCENPENRLRILGKLRKVR